jgi:SAM-dependent methyltransferase
MELNRVSIPLFELDANGALLPNPLFHRSFDFMHSRCIEYPFAASQITGAQRLLDVGSVKADSFWINWLENLPLEVHTTDYDEDEGGVFKRAKFQQADVRHLPYEDNTFDTILAVSVIEHIGLDSPQVKNEIQPSHEAEGDIAAVKELLRVLKPNGRLVMTFPYSHLAPYDDRLQTARIYGDSRLAKFSALADPETLDYYEYQFTRKSQLYVHHAPKARPSFRGRLKNTLSRILPKETQAPVETFVRSPMQGQITWRRIPREKGQASNHQGHIDGVICGVWRKKDDSN